MSTIIGSNLSSLSAQRRLGEAESKLSKTYQRLSSGKRINSPADDAAGLATAATLEVGSRIYTQAVRNLNDGLSYTAIADGAMKELKSILYRQRELATQSVNGCYTNEQRAAMDTEVQQLSSEWNRIISATTFNGRKVFSSKEGTLTLQSGMGTDGILRAAFGSSEAASQKDVVRASEASDGSSGSGSSDDRAAAISPDGRYIAFSTLASNLIGGDLVPAQPPSADLQFSAAGNANQLGPADCFYLEFPAFGAYFWFNVVDGTTFDPMDPDGKMVLGYQIDIHSSWSATQVRNAAKAAIDAAAGGNLITSDSGADALHIVAASSDPSIFDPASTSWGNAGSVVTVSSVSRGVPPLISSDTNLAKDIYIKDLQSGRITRVSTSSSQSEANGDSLAPALSQDGRYLLFASSASNLTPNDTNSAYDIFLKDLQTGQLRLVSTSSSGVQGNSYSQNPEITADNRYVVFESNSSNLISGDTNDDFDVFVKDLLTGTTRLVSSTSGGVQGNNDSYDAVISADGRYVIFGSTATNLVASDNNGKSDIFIKDLQTGTTRRVSTTAAGTQANDDCRAADVSADGRYITFQSKASTLTSGDANNAIDIFVKDLQSGEMKLVSCSSAGAAGNGDSQNPSISADGRYVTFESSASNLVAGDTNNQSDVFIKDLQTGEIARLTAASGSSQGCLWSKLPTLSADGLYITFVSQDATFTYNNYAAGNPLADWYLVSRNQWLSVKTREEALLAQNAVDSYLSELSSIQGTLGATQSRLVTAANTLQSMTENLRSAESRIMDVDIADEAANLTKSQIMQRSASSILAQANQEPKIALMLLQNTAFI